MKQGTLYYDKECGRYNFDYTDEDGIMRGFIVEKFLNFSSMVYGYQPVWR